MPPAPAVATPLPPVPPKAPAGVAPPPTPAPPKAPAGTSPAPPPMPPAPAVVTTPPPVPPKAPGGVTPPLAPAPPQAPSNEDDVLSDLQGGEQPPLKRAFFDFDQTISRSHVFKLLAGWEKQSVPP